MKKTTKKLTICALLVALGVILSRFLSIPVSLAGAYSFNIGFGMLPILLLAVLYGPIYGAIGAAAWDLLGALIFPKGAFVIWFTIAAAAVGGITGLFFADPSSGRYNERRASILRTFIAIFCGQFVYSVVLNTMLITLLYHVPVAVLLPPRLIENAIMIVVNTILVRVLLRALHAARIITDKLPEKSKRVISEPEKKEYNVHEIIPQIGAYISVGRYEKARDLYESVMDEYKKSQSEFSEKEKSLLVEYKKTVSFYAPEKMPDIDKELAELEGLISKDDTQSAKAKMEEIFHFLICYDIFTERQKDRFLNARMNLIEKAEND